MENLLNKFVEGITAAGSAAAGVGDIKLRGTVVLMKKNVLDFNDFNASLVDRLDEFLGRKVSLHLISSGVPDVVHATSPVTDNNLKGKPSKPAYLEDWITTFTSLSAGESAFKATFDWNEHIGVPAAFIIKNFHHDEFYLKSLTLEGLPGHDRIHFVCNSWVYPSSKYKTDRIFFFNQTYLPKDTPEPLRRYRDEELTLLRGDGTGRLQEWDRVYDYAYYNDLADPDKGAEYARPVLGGSSEYPYPRRGRTGRPPTKTDPTSESRLKILTTLDVYVPRDERYGHLKMADFLAYNVKSISQLIIPEIEGTLDKTPNEFDSFDDVMKLYEGGIKLPNGILHKLSDDIPLEFVKGLLPREGEGLLKYPKPDLIKVDKSAWRTDEEFAREMLAGANPMIITGLHEFPPTSKLDSEVYGNQTSSITRQHIEPQLSGLTVDEALKTNRLFILDHHDTIMQYLRRINATSTKTYASRTLLFLKDDGTLKPLAIELSLPHPDEDRLGSVSKVYTPPEEENGVENSIWQLAKAFVAVNDSGVHQLISHWLRTHAVIEPFVIATNRQLSVLHPVYKLLHPHYRDTMNINAIGRQILINAGGVVEISLFPGKYTMELSSLVYKDWVFTDQALPTDLLKRKVAVEDPESPYGVRLLIEDYPFAVDGLKIWSAIKGWVKEYCSIYYKNDEMIQSDIELQSWWKEVVEKGHEDKKDEPWWPKMETRDELIDSCTTIIWVASALHASTNFGQWPYAGYHPNRPTKSREFMPEPGSSEYDELKVNPDKVFLKTITSQLQSLLGLSIIELLSRHTSDEVYLGQRESGEWTKDTEALEAFERFGQKLSSVEEEMKKSNDDPELRNRNGAVKIPYTLLFPTSGVGITGRGIPNSVAI